VKIIGVTVKDKILRAVLVAAVVGVGNFAETEDGTSAPAVEVGK
jgi:hypothetical protein